jgi:F-type H+-transporting ATPase subunit a
MEESILGITKLVNAAFGKIALALLSLLHIHPSNPQYPIPNSLAMEFLVFALAVVFFLWLKSRLSVENPGGSQQVMELLLRNPMSLGVVDVLESNIAHGATKYLPMIGSIGLFVLFCNLISVVPGLASPTAEKEVPLGCAIVVFLYYNVVGIGHHGVWGYSKQFLKMPIEIISHVARLLSLTVRLWVNMLVSEMLYGIFLGLMLALFLFVGKLNAIGYVLAPAPLFVPVIFIILHIFVAFVQAFVFTILPVIYLAGAVSEGH